MAPWEKKASKNYGMARETVFHSGMVFCNNIATSTRAGPYLWEDA